MLIETNLLAHFIVSYYLISNPLKKLQNVVNAIKIRKRQSHQP